MKKFIQTELMFLIAVWVLFYTGCLSTKAVEMAQTFQTEGGIYYQITDQNTIRVTGARESLSAVEIPAEVDGMPVTQIGDYAFYNHTRILSISVPDSVLEIGNYAFRECSRLEEITIPDSVQNVGMGILSETPWLAAQTAAFVIVGNQILICYTGSELDVVVPDGVRIIAGFAFERNMDVQTVALPDTVCMINAYAFAGCHNLQRLTIPPFVTSIGKYAFYECKQLQSVSIPDSVTQIGDYAFYQCVSLKEVRLPIDLREINSNLFLNCAALQTVLLPEGLEKISDYAFRNCTSLCRIVLPSTVASVGKEAFYQCTNLKQVIFLSPDSVIFSDGNIFPAQTILLAAENSAVQTYAETHGQSFVALPVLYGDVNGDGEIMVEDAVMILTAYAQSCAGLPNQLTPRQQVAADYNQDGGIFVEDAVAVLVHYARSAAGLCA